MEKNKEYPERPTTFFVCSILCVKMSTNALRYNCILG